MNRPTPLMYHEDEQAVMAAREALVVVRDHHPELSEVSTKLNEIIAKIEKILGY